LTFQCPNCDPSEEVGLREVNLVSESCGKKKWIVGGIQMLSTPNRSIASGVDTRQISTIFKDDSCHH
jgi:hypothetical protein